MDRIEVKAATAGALVVVAAFLVAACGSGGSSSSGSESQKAGFTVAMQTDAGQRDAFATFTSRSDGKTSAVVEFTIERTDSASGDLYAVTERGGSCDSLGDVMIEVGEASNGVTTFVLDQSFDDVVGPLRDASANIVIAKKGSDTADWCGATENAG
jgi:hypothetical protein